MTTLLGVDLAGRRVVVVGGGAVANRRVPIFLADAAAVVVVAPELTDALATLADSREIEWRQRPYEPADLDGARLVVAATDDQALNDTVSADAEQREILCINASDAARGSARMAATSRHGDIALGVVSLADPDPRRLRAIRDALALHIDADIPDLRHRRKGAGRVVLIGTGPGDPELMTIAARRALAEANVVVADRLGAVDALAHVPAEVELVDVGKARDSEPVSQEEINTILVDSALAGNVVVRFKGGDPFVFGRGGEEMHACIDAGVPCQMIPGISSALSVPALAGIPVTQRGIARSFLVTTGHEGPEPAMLAAIIGGATVVVLMGVKALDAICTEALAAGASAKLPVAIIESGSTPRERVTYAELGSAARTANETGVKAPAIIVIGEVARAGLLKSTDAATPH